jgi:hypothetical protein
MLLLARPAEQFKATATFDPDGDCIEFLAKPDPFYAERVDDLVTVYYSQETGEVVGSLIKGISQFCREIVERAPGFRITIEDAPIRLDHIFLARMWTKQTEPEEMVTLVYQKLIDVAKETGAEIDGELCLS